MRQPDTAPLRFVTQFFPPERNAPANRVSVLTRQLSRLTKTEVYTPLPSYPDASQYAHLDVAALDREVGLDVRRSPAFRAHGGFLIRGARETILALSLVRKALEGEVGSLWVTAPTMFLIPAAIRMATSRGVPVVVDLRDLTWEYARDSALVGSPLHRRMVDILTREIESCLCRASVILVTNHGAEAALIRAGVPGERIMMLPNGIDEDRFHELGTVSAASARSPGSRLVVSYCGLVGHNQGLRSLVDVASEMPAVDFVVAGAGPELEELKAHAAKLSLGNVQFLGQVSWSRIKDVYSETDILFAQLRDQESLSRTAVPSKIFEYMAAGRPIVYSGGGVAGDLVQEAGAGVSVPASVSAIRGALEALASSESDRNRMGLTGRATAEKYIREHLASEVLPKVLKRIHQDA